jgi:hypothetical protein
MTERIGDIIVLDGDSKAVIALRGIISIDESAEEKPATDGRGFMLPVACTAITVEGGRRINVSPADGAFIRRCLKDWVREQAAQKVPR